jgi:ABC transporter substrate binding protein
MGLREDDLETKSRLAKLRQELERLRWSEGSNLHMDIRFAPAGDQGSVLAKELVALQPDVILAHTTPITAALQRESRTIPIVFAVVADPIGSGFIASLPQPGGNITGVSQYEASVTGKWLAMLKEIAPSLVRAGFVANPKTATYYGYFLRAGEALASSLGIEPVLPPGRLMLCDQTNSDRVGSNDEYDRRRRGCGFTCLRRRNAGPYDRGDLPAQKIGRQSR